MNSGSPALSKNRMQPLAGTMKRTLVMIPILLLTACSPASTPPAVVEPSMAATGTLPPAATATPANPTVYIHDLSTWPAVHREYFERSPGEWNNPAKAYISDREFDAFLQQGRLLLLEQVGIADVPLPVPGAPVREQAAFLEYIRWGLERRQVLILSPLEIRNLLTDADNIGAAYTYFDEDQQRHGTEGI